MKNAQAKYDAYVAHIESQYAPLREVIEQRDVARIVGKIKDKLVKAMFFEIKKEEVQDLRDYFARITRPRFLKMFKAYLEQQKKEES